MIIDNPSKRYEIVLGSARTTTDMPVCISYEDVPAGITGALDTQTNGTTAVPILTMTEARTKRALKEMTVNNVDTLPKTVTIRLVNGSTTRQVYSCVLQVGDMLGYTETAGFYVKDSNGNTKTIAAPNTATSGISPITSSASPDIFGAAGATINLDNSTPVTTTSFANCASAQVGSIKTVIPNANWNVTASANLIVDGATSGTFVMPANALIEVIPLTTTQFKVTTIFATGTWTPNQGSGLTVVGVFGSAGVWTKIGNQYTVSGYVTGTTSVAVGAAAQVISTNLPAKSKANFIIIGGAIDQAATNYAGLFVGQNSTTLYSITAIAATPQIYFSCIYTV